MAIERLEKLEKDKDGNKVIVVPFHIRHLGPSQSIVLDCGSKFSDVVNEPLPKSIILAHQYAQMLESGRGFFYSGKLGTRVAQFYSLLCDGDEKPLLR